MFWRKRSSASGAKQVRGRMSGPHPVAGIVEAIRLQDLPRLQQLLEKFPEELDRNTPMGGHTPLGYAARVGNLEIVSFLVNAGADVNKLDHHGYQRPICAAADSGHAEVVEYLLDQGARVDASASVQDPLFAAIVGRSPRIVRRLLEAGADSRVRYNSETMTEMDAVAFAVMHTQPECAEMIALWNSGGDAEAAAKALKDAARIARENTSIAHEDEEDWS